MAFTATEDILKRVEAALEFDLLGRTERSFSSDKPNDGLDPLNASPVCEAVLRYTLDPELTGYLYASNRGTGIVVGYSYSSQQPDDQPIGGTQNSIQHTLPLEVTSYSVAGSFGDLLDGSRGFQLDALNDDIMRIFQGNRRDSTNFGGGDIGPVNYRGNQKLEGAADAAYVGRTHRINIGRDLRDLQ